MLRALRIAVAALLTCAWILGCAPKPEVQDTGPGAAAPTEATTTQDAAKTGPPPGTNKDAAAPDNPVSSSD